MITAAKNGRKIHAMIMNEPSDACLGVVQCALAGCEAWMAIIVGSDSANSQVEWFLNYHQCKARP